MMFKASSGGDMILLNEERAFQTLFVDYYPSLLSFARRFVEDKDVSEDLVQDVFVKVWENRKHLEGVEDISAYLYQMVRFKCFNHLRNEKVRNKATQLFVDEFDIECMETYIQEETYRMVMNALDDLSPACREVFTRFVQGYKAKDIAEELNIAVETVKKQKQIARKILKERLGKLFLFVLIYFPLGNR